MPGRQGNLPRGHGPHQDTLPAPLPVPGGQGVRQTCPAGAGSSPMQGQLCLSPPEGRVPAPLGHSWYCRWHWRVCEGLGNKHPARANAAAARLRTHVAPADRQGRAARAVRRRPSRPRPEVDGRTHPSRVSFSRTPTSPAPIRTVQEAPATAVREEREVKGIRSADGEAQLSPRTGHGSTRREA